MEDGKLTLVSVSSGRDYLGFLSGKELTGAIDVSHCKGEGNCRPFSETVIQQLVQTRARKTDAVIDLTNCDFCIENAPTKVLDYLTHCNNVMAECQKDTLGNLIADRFSRVIK